MTQDAPQHAELQVGAVSTDATTDMTKSATSKSYVTFTPRLGQDSGASIDQGSVQEQYRTYKMRWLGLGVLTLLNMMVSWAWLTFSPVVSDAAEFYRVDESTINWLSSIFVFANFAMTFVTIRLLDWGLRPTIITGSSLLIIGNWIRYAGSSSLTSNKVAVVAVGQALLGMAQSLVLSAPTRFSETWFTTSGRVTATAVMSLANPMGAAVGQVVNPFWVSKSADVASMVLYVSIISSAVALPGFFIPEAPPTPPAPSGVTMRLPILESLRRLITSLEFFLIIIPFWVFTGFFVATTTLINQIVKPYGFSDTEAGIGGGLLIVLGLIASGIAAPIVDRNKKYLFVVKCGVVLGALCYLALIWVPTSREVGALYALLGVLGVASLAIVPVVLEVLTELSYPVGPEITSTIAWAVGQLLGGCFILLGNAMKAGQDAHIPRNLTNFVIFQAVFALALVPLPLSLGLFGRADKVLLKRTRID
ncbi:hypothetical protein AUP68_00675 [Ilyonectria robusta]